MNNVQRSTFWLKIKRLIMWPFYQIKWAITRHSRLIHFMKVSFSAKELELEIKKLEQIRNDHQFAGRVDEYKQMRSFIEGIQYCLERKWFKE